MDHCYSNMVVHSVQMGCASGQLRCVNHLLLNIRVWQQLRRNRSLLLAWLSYKQAYGFVPHNWIVYCLKLFLIHSIIDQYVKHLLLLWLSAYLKMPGFTPVRLAAVSIHCGIFQGDT